MEREEQELGKKIEMDLLKYPEVAIVRNLSPITEEITSVHSPGGLKVEKKTSSQAIIEFERDLFLGSNLSSPKQAWRSKNVSPKSDDESSDLPKEPKLY